MPQGDRILEQAWRDWQSFDRERQAGVLKYCQREEGVPTLWNPCFIARVRATKAFLEEENRKKIELQERIREQLEAKRQRHADRAQEVRERTERLRQPRAVPKPKVPPAPPRPDTDVNVDCNANPHHVRCRYRRLNGQYGASRMCQGPTPAWFCSADENEAVSRYRENETRIESRVSERRRKRRPPALVSREYERGRTYHLPGV